MMNLQVILKKVFITFLILTSFHVSAQTFNMSNTPVSTCSGTFYDSGGAGGNYNDGAGFTQTFTSDNGNRIRFTFSSFSTYSSADVLYIYDGPNNTYPFIGAYANGSSPGTITSTGTSLTFVFAPNNAGSSTAGWAATISCTTPALTIYNMNTGTVTACEGVFYDNAGATAPYAVSEDRTQTFCSDNGEHVQFTFNQASFGLASGDSLFIYDGSSIASNPLAILVSGSIAEQVTSSGTCLTFRFKSNATTTATGWQATFQCTSSMPSATSYSMSSGVRYTCGGAFFDDGGAGGFYNDGANHVQTLTSYNGNRISLAFTTFNTYSTADVLYIYDGPNTSYPLIGAYSTSSSPGTVTSSGASLTFVFNVNNASSSTQGWAATISCTTPVLQVYNMSGGTVNACAGAFYDFGGASASYPASEDRTQTFCSDNGEHLQFDFNQAAFSLSGGDSLFIYDGPTATSNPLAVYVAGSVAETVTSTSTCLTFKFKSDAGSVASGWQASFSCVATLPGPVSYSMSSGIRYTCGGSFFDDGGSGGYYNDYANHTQTFTSYNGNRLSFNFTLFNTYSNADVLYIYDGPNTSYPLIGSYTNSSSPGNIMSTGASLTFVFNVNSAGSSTQGWAASISCTTPVLPVYNMSSGTVNGCEGVFYDNSGANANYPISEDRTQTFCSDNGEFLEFTFNQAAFSLNSGDSLFVFDGSTTSALPIAVFVSGSIAEKITSTGTCLTFRFKSNATTVASGWQASFRCVPSQPAATNYSMSSGIRYTCGGTFYDNGGATGFYNDYVNLVQTFTSSNGNRISFNFSSFSTSTNADVLYIYDGPTTAYPFIGAYSVSSNPGIVTSTGTSLTFVFNVNGAGSSTQGWAATISCTTPVLDVYTMSGGTTTACSGVFYDNTGATGNYPLSENRTQTFCSDNGEFLEFTFNQAAFNLASGDSLFIFDGSSISAAPIAILVAGSVAEKITSTGTCLTFRFKSDATTAAIGWQASFRCVSTQPAATSYSMSSGVRYTCGGTFYDDGGATGFYNDYVNHVQTFTSSNGNRISFSFSSFSTSTTADVLYIYDGPNTTYPFLGAYATSASPGTVTSTGTSLTFVFNVNGAGSSTAGWAASISCTTPVLQVYNMSGGTTTACSGVFYDNGGANANYSASENRVQTFCSDNGEYLQFSFNRYSFNFAAGDSLFVYDGSSIAAQPIAIFVSGAFGETITSTGTCLTFKFKSDAGSTASGWQSAFTCTSVQPAAPVFTMSGGVRYTCGAMFYDDGGASGNYNDYVSRTQTFISTGGCAIRATFTSLSTATSSDYLRIFDGPNTSSPIIGTYSVSTNPGIVQGSGSALTFQFITNGLGSSAAGWVASLTCPNQTAPPVVTSNSPVCEGDAIQFTTQNIPGATFTWSGPDGFTSTAQSPSVTTSTPASSGNYMVSATVGGCTSNQTSIQVSVNPRPSAPVAINSGPHCSGQALSLSSTAVSGATYSWTGPDGFTSTSQNPTIPAATVNSTGTYTVTAVVGVCTVTDTTVATIHSTPSFSNLSSNGPLCEGADLVLSAAASNSTAYSWSGPNGFSATGTPVTVTSATTAATGTYTVTATNANCSSTGTVHAIVTTAPTAPVVTSNSPVCEGQSLTMSATSVSGSGYSWNGPSGFTSSSQSPSVSSATVLATGTYTVTASLNGCSSTSTISLTVKETPDAPVASNNGPACSNGSVTLNATTVSGATYLWSGPNSFTSTLQNPTIASVSFTDAGVYSVVSVLNGCQSSASNTTVTVNTVAPSVSSNGVMCEGDSLQLNATTLTGATYSWTGPNGFSSSIQNPVINPATSLATGTYSVTATVNGCVSDPSTISVSINARPAAPVLSNNGPLCSGDQLVLSATLVPGASYAWSGPQGFSSTLQNPVVNNIFITQSGTYTAHTIMNGCSSANSTTAVIVNQRPSTPVITSNDPLCEGGTLILGATNVSNATYQWTGPSGYTSNDQNPIISNITSASSGSYSVVVTANGCSSNAATETVTVYQAPAAPVITYNSTLGLLESSYGNDNQWYLNGTILNGETSQTLFYLMYGSNGPYTVAYTDINGCSTTSAPYTVGAVSVRTQSDQDVFNVYPSPSDGNFTIDVKGLSTEKVMIRIVNAIGEAVYEESFNGGQDINLKYTLTLAPGLYTVTIHSAEILQKRSLIIAR